MVVAEDMAVMEAMEDMADIVIGITVVADTEAMADMEAMAGLVATVVTHPVA
jgi:hypothetical protein